MKKSNVIAVLLVLITIGGVIFAVSKKTNSPNSTSTTNTNTTSQTTNSTGTSSSAESVITYSNSGFSPSSLTVKSGDKVTIKNNSSGLVQFDSDPHPDHTDDTELNIGIIGPGNSTTITVTKTGSHGYHNHLNPDD